MKSESYGKLHKIPLQPFSTHVRSDESQMIIVGNAVRIGMAKISSTEVEWVGPGF